MLPPGKGEKLHDISSQFDVVTSAILAHSDALDEPPQDLGRLRADFGIVQRSV